MKNEYVAPKDQYPPVVLEDSIKFEDGYGYVRMTFDVEQYYQTPDVSGDPDSMGVNKMVITYMRNSQTLEFSNDDDYYGQGQHISFKMINKFKEHLESLGLEVV